MCEEIIMKRKGGLKEEEGELMVASCILVITCRVTGNTALST